MTPKRVARGLVWQDVVDAAHKLSGVKDGTSYGTPALFVGKKLLARLKEDGETVVMRTDAVSRSFLLKADPVMYHLTDHYRDHPWVLVALPRASRAALVELLEDAWELLAGARRAKD